MFYDELDRQAALMRRRERYDEESWGQETDPPPSDRDRDEARLEDKNAS